MSSMRVFRTFLEVARTGSFAAASERVSLSAAAVGLQMRTLEEELGTTLFNRKGTLVSLSANGHRMLPRVEKLLACYAELTAETGDEQIIGTLKVSSIATALSMLARVVLAVRAQHPRLEIHSSISYAADAVQVKNSEVDASIGIKGSHRLNGATLWTPLWAEPFVFVANRRSSKTADVQELLKKKLFLRSARGFGTGALIEAFLRREGLKVYDYLEMHSLRSMIELVEQDVGVTVVPLLRNATWTKNRALRVISFNDAAAHRVVGLFEREDRLALTSVIRAALLTLV